MKETVKLINDARTRGVYVVADMYPYHYASGGRILPIARNAGWAPFHLPNDMEPFAELRKKMTSLPASFLQMKDRGLYAQILCKAS